MSGARRLPAIATVLAVGFSLAAASTNASVRHVLSRTLGLKAPGGAWRALAILLALLNLKNLPFVWHYRLFRALIYQLYIQPKELPPEALFLPAITTSYTPMYETDYNFHKSNSTYFTDLDIARTHLVTAILRKGIRGIGKHPENRNAGWSFANTTRAAGKPNSKDGKPLDSNEMQEPNKNASQPEHIVANLQINPFGTSMMDSSMNTPVRARTPEPAHTSAPAAASSADPKSSSSSSNSSNNNNNNARQPFGGLTEEQWWVESQKPGTLLIALGGNSCHYHREIPPFTRFEIWTRILSWDRKWIYVVSHFVEAGAFRPRRFVLQPWKNRPAVVVGDESRRAIPADEQRQRRRRKIYATSVSKYVVKKGRLTIPPELVLQRSDMLPERPPGAPSTFFNAVAGGASPESADGQQRGDMPVQQVLEESLFAAECDGKDEAWTWERVESERQKGLRLCQMFDGLDGLRDTFDSGEDGVMGRFTDLLGGF